MDKVGNKETYEECILSSRRSFFFFLLQRKSPSSHSLDRDSETSKGQRLLGNLGTV